MPSRIPSGQILKCADPVVEVGVEKIIVHPDYNDKSRDKMHDIALLRLNTNVTYSKYIKPICLPREGLNSGLITGNKLTVAGWGSTNGMHFSQQHNFAIAIASERAYEQAKANIFTRSHSTFSLKNSVFFRT